METKDLRVGNYVEFEDEIYTVVSVDGDRVTGLQRKWLGNECMSYNLDTFPLPLTEEWLIKFGCKKYGNFYVLSSYLHTDISISIINKKTTIGSNEEYEIEHIEFVHQFQNFYFCLTGKELEIEQ